MGGWSGVYGETGVRDLSADVNVRFIDLLHHLRFGAMGTFEVELRLGVGIADAFMHRFAMNHTLELDPRAARRRFHAEALHRTGLHRLLVEPEQTVAVDFSSGPVWSTQSTLNVSGDIVSRER